MGCFDSEVVLETCDWVVFFFVLEMQFRCLLKCVGEEGECEDDEEMDS